MEQENIDRIEAYHNGSLNADEKKQLEVDMASDPSLKELFNEYFLAIEAVDAQVEQDLRRKFREWGSAEEDKTTKSRTIGWPGVWRYAASAVVLLGISYVFFVNDADQSRREIALSYYELPSNPGSEMGSSDHLWSDGLESFYKEEYTDAAELWSKISDPTNEQQYFLAHAYFNADSLQQAATLFEQISGASNNYSQIASWNLLLTYLSLEDSLNFRRQHAKIMSSEQNGYKELAEELADKSKY